MLIFEISLLNKYKLWQLHLNKESNLASKNLKSVGEMKIIGDNSPFIDHGAINSQRYHSKFLQID